MGAPDREPERIPPHEWRLFLLEVVDRVTTQAVALERAMAGGGRTSHIVELKPMGRYCEGRRIFQTWLYEASRRGVNRRALIGVTVVQRRKLWTR